MEGVFANKQWYKMVNTLLSEIEWYDYTLKKHKECNSYYGRYIIPVPLDIGVPFVEQHLEKLKEELKNLGYKD